MGQHLLQIMGEIVNIRSYKSDQLSDDMLHDLYQAFRLGPSSISTQASELLVVEGKSQRQKVVDATLDPYMTKDSYGAQSWLLEVLFAGVVLIEKRRAMARVGEMGVSIAKQEAAASIQNVRLLARYHGLSTACVHELDPDILKQKLSLPWYMEPITVISAGYHDAPITSPPRLSLKDVIHREGWQ